MLVELAAHWLVRVDHGPLTLALAERLADQAVEQGVGRVCVTPSIPDAWTAHWSSVVGERYAELAAHLATRHPGLVLYRGAESLWRGALDADRAHAELSLAGLGQSLLVRLTADLDPARFELALFHQKQIGRHTVLIAPELVLDGRDAAETLARWTRMGALVVVEADSLLGGRGKDTQRLVVEWCQHDIVYAITSSSFHPRHGPVRLAAAHRDLTKRFGQPYADEVCRDHPWALLEGRAPRG